ncbi:glycosyltransferase family 9 protein [Trichothermofontia sichuanensis B231]|uniref:glycosyltransferase family 9 protein n=1 Tax=Trichothermofontia sichuanensis TaxID=3045816 RepID=UPI0022467E39|nr:glycosyltransferase family 9 protein [Trichothermofontia sichuanensis]UZQ54181.1 glycosyltransferase family 9 protein [Trichothermofontia sichuanensis B231]
MRILVLIPGDISNQILCFPTLDDLKRIYPKAQVDVLVEPRAKAAYRVCRSVHEALPFDYQDRNSPADLVNLLGIMRDREFDAVISLASGWVTGFLLWLAGIAVRVGYADQPGSFFLTHPVPLKSEQYVAHTYHDLLQGLGIATPCPDIAINVPRKDIDWAEAEQTRLGVKETGYILIYDEPAAATTAGTYPPSAWQAVIEGIQARQPQPPIVLLRTPDNQAVVAEILKLCPTAKVTAPAAIGQQAAMIAGANLVICPDSAPLQLAVAVQSYMIALLPTPTLPILPKSEKYLAVQSPTANLADIKPDAVLAKMFGQ